MNDLQGGWLHGITIIDGHSQYNTTKIFFKFIHPHFFQNMAACYSLIDKIQEKYNPNNVSGECIKKRTITVDTIYDILYKDT
jgi:hypothetical protein